MSQPELKTEIEQRTPTALVVEPAPAMARLLRTMMEDLGFKVIEAGGLDAAITEIENRDTGIDLVLSELSLQEVSGTKLASFISKRRPSIPRVLLCDQRVPDCFSLNSCATFLRKPFTREQLAAALQIAAMDTAHESPQSPGLAGLVAPNAR